MPRVAIRSHFEQRLQLIETLVSGSLRSGKFDGRGW